MVRQSQDDSFEVAAFEFEVLASDVAKPFVAFPEPMSGDGGWRRSPCTRRGIRSYLAAVNEAARKRDDD